MEMPGAPEKRHTKKTGQKLLAKKTERNSLPEERLLKKEEWLSELEMRLTKPTMRLMEKEKRMSLLEERLAKEAERLTEISRKLTNKEEKIGELESQLHAMERGQAVHKERIESLLNSYSWKVSSPLRLATKTLGPLITKFSKTVSSKKSLNKSDSIAKKSSKYISIDMSDELEAEAEKKGEGKQTKEVLIECDFAKPLSNLAVNVGGWALSGCGIDRVEVYLDDTLLGLAKTGLQSTKVQFKYYEFKESAKSGFVMFAVFKTKPSFGTHVLKVKAIDKGGNHAESVQSIELFDPYPVFLNRTEPADGTLNWMREVSAGFSVRPSISLALTVSEDNLPYLSRSIDSIKAQVYPCWDISVFYERELSGEITDKLSSLSDGNRLKLYPIDTLEGLLDRVNGDFICLMGCGDILAPHALFELAKKINIDNGYDIIYADEDRLQDGRRDKPFFKPDWSPDLILSMNYIGRALFIRRGLFKEAGGIGYGLTPKGIYDLVLRATERTKDIGHIPKVLYTSGSGEVLIPEAGKEVLEDAIKRRGIDGEVIALERPGTYRVKRKISGNPRVSIIYLTAYKNPEKFIKASIRSIVEKSTYKNYEIILVDNSFGKLPLKEIKKIIPDSVPVQHIKYKKEYNFSKMSNMAWEKATGDYLVFLNDDTEFISPDWMEAMLEHAQRPEVGIVGSSMVDKDLTIQHGGKFFVDNGGFVRDAFRFIPKDFGTYQGLFEVIRNCSSVTFACVMISKDIYYKLNGLEEELVVKYNDTDFCHRAMEANYLAVYTPYSFLYNSELTTEKTNVISDRIIYKERWQHLIERGDPYYNPNLTMESDNFSINERPVVVEHHEPFLPSDTEVEFHKNTPVAPESIKKILVIKLDRTGDVILSLPAIKILKDKFPKASITMLVGSSSKEPVGMVPFVDDVLTFDFFHKDSERWLCQQSSEEWDELEKTLKQFAFDLAVDLRIKPETRRILSMSGARYTAAYCGGEGHNCPSICVKPTEDMIKIPGQTYVSHKTTQLCRLTWAIDAKDQKAKKTAMPLISEVPLINKQDSDLLKEDLLLGIYPGGGDTIKQWPPEYFARLADQVIERSNAQVLIFGSKSEMKLSSKVLKMMRHGSKAASLAGKLSHQELISMIKVCDLFVGNVGDPGYLAGLLGVPTLTVFSGQVLPHECHTLGRNTMTIRMAIPCSPCYEEKDVDCPNNMKCLDMLWPEKVYSATRELMAVTGNMSMPS